MKLRLALLLILLALAITIARSHGTPTRPGQETVVVTGKDNAQYKSGARHIDVNQLERPL